MSDDDENPATPKGLPPELTKLAYDIGMRVIMKNENGIASLSEHTFPWPLPERADDGTSVSKGLKLEWQDARELQVVYGLVSCAIILNGTKYGGLGRKPIGSVKADIIRLLGHDSFDLIEAAAPRLEDESNEPDLHAIFFRALWVQLFAKELDVKWLAAMAEHAHFVVKNDFAFGYLIALLDQKLGNETDFLRGKKVVEGASKSNAERAAQRKAHRAKVIAAMRRYITGKFPSINRAARLAFENGIGKSTDANRKTYERYA